MGTNRFDNKKYCRIIAVCVVVILLLLYQFWALTIQNNQLIEKYEKALELEIQKKEKVIVNYERQINISKNEIKRLITRQAQYEHSLDSLREVKQKVKIIYENRIVEVQNFDSKKVQQYWRKKFKVNE
jgi:hypothetical protein